MRKLRHVRELIQHISDEVSMLNASALGHASVDCAADALADDEGILLSGLTRMS